MFVIKSQQKKVASRSRRQAVRSPRIAVKAIALKARNIPLSYSGHVRGHHPVRDGHEAVQFESLTERAFIAAVASLPELVSIESQPLTIYFTADGQRRRYTPDFVVRLSEVPPALECLGFGLETYVECKPADLVPAHHDELDRNFRAMGIAVRAPMLLITDEDLASGALGVTHGA